MLCLRINCPALAKASDGFISINPHLCTGCGLCVQVCPNSALVTGSDHE
jgi:indolepyruvate ferredoxin oxidoreductase alpha subunit